ncbi:hypothetical protein ABZU32_20295 [Sphaerisporangium sp. NPDC005288]|uniref:hypothetical protein n=1 Tax=Sphaerisporangium sp. NPDC005288 TaxID=3155114 RepID=UPI0033B5044C
MGARNEVPPPRREEAHWTHEDARCSDPDGGPYPGREDAPDPVRDDVPDFVRDDVPPPAYFLRSLPAMPVTAWLRAWATSLGPFAAGLVLAFAMGAGVALGLHPACGGAAVPHARVSSAGH